jgi:hypothetical protein
MEKCDQHESLWCYGLLTTDKFSPDCFNLAIKMIRVVNYRVFYLLRQDLVRGVNLCL